MENSPVDLDLLFSEFRDREALLNLLDRFAADLPNRLDSLEGSAKDGQWGTAKDICHAVRGSAANFTAVAFAEAAGKLEALARNNRWDESIFLYLRDEAQRITLYLQEQRKESRP